MSQDAVRILAVDLGAVRIGLALSDRLGLSAYPLGALQRKGARRDFSELRRLIQEHEVTRAVVGLPLLMSGEEGSAAVQARSFADKLKGAVDGLDVDMWDERLTTVEAERLLIEAEVKPRRRRQVVDSLAATLILQSYLDAREREERAES
jgi:putative Holliday junction resolvase